MGFFSAYRINYQMMKMMKWMRMKVFLGCIYKQNHHYSSKILDVPIFVSSQGFFRISLYISLFNPLDAILDAIRTSEIGIDNKYLIHRINNIYFFRENKYNLLRRNKNDDINI